MSHYLYTLLLFSQELTSTANPVALPRGEWCEACLYTSQKFLIETVLTKNFVFLQDWSEVEDVWRLSCHWRRLVLCLQWWCNSSVWDFRRGRFADSAICRLNLPGFLFSFNCGDCVLNTQLLPVAAQFRGEWRALFAVSKLGCIAFIAECCTWSHMCSSCVMFFPFFWCAICDKCL